MAALGCGDDDSDSTDGGALTVDAGSTVDAARVTPDVGGSVQDGAVPLPGNVTQGIDAAVGLDAAVTPARPVLYAMPNEIYTADDSTTYINALPSLDIKALDTSKALEFAGGRATIGTVDGRLFIAEPGAPVITRFSVSDSGAFSKEAQISFSNYSSEAVELDEWSNIFISATKAYAFFDGITIVWNPSSMEIVKEIDQSAYSFTREGFELNGGGAVARGNRVYRTVFWSNWETYTSSPEQFLAVYDTDSDKLIAFTPETRCPALSNRVERDEAGNLYFSNWIWNVPETLVRNAKKSCVLRLPAGSDNFDTWQLTYSDLTEGREGAMFAYLGNGRAMMSVFHAERTTVDASIPLNELASGDNWRLWTIDLATMKAAPLEGLDWNAGAVSTYHLDGRSFVFLPGEEWSITHVHELKASGATALFDAKGWSYQLLKVR